jgi:hypothetical protein
MLERADQRRDRYTAIYSVDNSVTQQIQVWGCFLSTKSYTGSRLGSPIMSFYLIDTVVDQTTGAARPPRRPRFRGPALGLNKRNEREQG